MRSAPYADPETIRDLTDRWLRRIAGASRPRPWLRPDPRRCALLVIDMLRYFADPAGGGYLPASRAAIPGIRALLERWRRLGAPVAYTLHCHRDGEDAGMMGRFFTDLIRCGTEDARILDALSPVDGEPVFVKDSYDAFRGTALEEHLRASGAEQVLVTGVLTQLCVETTARAAFVRGFEVYVAADASASSTEDLHLGSLMGMASGVAVVTSVERILGDDA